MTAPMRSQPLARALSILGHPLCVLPLAALLTIFANGGSPRTVVIAGAAFAVLGLAVMGYCWRQVRAARWRHVDASGGTERRALNRILLLALPLAAAVAWPILNAPPLALGLLLATLPVLLGVLLARWLTLSLHVAFSAYAALLLWSVSLAAVAAGLAFTTAVAWSRLALQRHLPRDLAAGAVAGLLAGVSFWVGMA